MLQALAEEGLVTIMAEPNLTARSGEPRRASSPAASIPTPTVSDEGTNVQFKDFGIGLNFTPTVIDGNRISLKVATEVSELDFANSAERALAQHPPRRDHRRPRQRPELRHRRADAERLVAEHLADAGAGHGAGARRAVPLARLQARPDRARDHRDAGDRQADDRPAAWPRRPTSFVPPNDFERILLGRFQGNPQQAEQVQNRLGQRRLIGQSGFVFE